MDSAVGTTTKGTKELQHYDRVALAEAVVEREGESLRQSTFLEFRRRVDVQGSEREWWQPARESVSSLINSQDAVAMLMKELKKLAVAIGAETEMESQLANEADPEGRQR